MISIDFILQLIGTGFFVAAAFNGHIRGTNSVGIGLACWAAAFLF